MFLLIHRPARWSCTANDFTFQYVSINTEKTCTLGWAQNYFTFQYVSINTEQRYDEQQAEIDLYIPICFY